MKPISISAETVRRLNSPEWSRSTLSRATKDAGVKPLVQRGNRSYYKVTDIAKLFGVDKREIYERLEAAL